MTAQYVTTDVDEAWAIHARICRRHASEPERWSEPERVRERAESHARFIELFEAKP